MADIGTAVKKATQQDAVQGAYITHHKVTAADPASVAAAAVGAQTISVPGVKVGDLVLSCLPNSQPENQLVVVGAKVTATDVVTVYFGNEIDATTAINEDSIDLALSILHLS